MFEGFTSRTLPTPRGSIHACVKGEGPPLLLLHGWPETHVMWHSTAPALAERFTVVCADLPGYGASSRPPVTADHEGHSKRVMAEELVAAMIELGFDSFAVAGHDRGARVAYRMALDHPDRVHRLAVMDVVPTGEVWARADDRFAIGYWHWPFLAQAAPLPEALIGAAPGAFFDTAVAHMGIDASSDRYPEPVIDTYRALMRDPGAVEAMCEDYRAGATVDREHDDARGDGRIACPTLALWAANGALPLFYDDPLAIWRDWCDEVSGHAVDASHFLVEDAPEEVGGELATFFAA